MGKKVSSNVLKTCMNSLEIMQKIQIKPIHIAYFRELKKYDVDRNVC